jgi:hypothetical protein
MATARLAAPSPLGIFQAAATRTEYPPEASSLPANAITYYRCTLTGAPDGLPDLDLPISSFIVRHRAGADSYYSTVVPTVAVVEGIAARSNGEVVIWSQTGAVVEEVLRGALASIATAEGASSQSITLSGNTPSAPTDPQTYVLGQVQYLAQKIGGETRLRLPPRAAMRPGDTVIYRGVYTAVGDVTWSVAIADGSLTVQMEIATG